MLASSQLSRGEMVGLSFAGGEGKECSLRLSFREGKSWGSLSREEKGNNAHFALAYEGDTSGKRAIIYLVLLLKYRELYLHLKSCLR